MNIKQSIKIIIIGLILSAGLALAWTAPTVPQPPAPNPSGVPQPGDPAKSGSPTLPAAPIDTSALNQIKTGGLATGSFTVNPGISNFYGNVSVAANKNMITNTGAVGIGTAPSASYKLSVAGGVRATSLVYGGTSDRGQICANSSGILSLCPQNTITFTPTGGPGTLPCPSPSCSWTVPDGVFQITVDVFGAGGGGGSAGSGGSSFGGGGGGGGHAIGVFNVNPNQILTLVTGAGGAGGVGGTPAFSGSDGGQSNFSYFLQATGGKGGKGGPAGGSGGAGGTGIINFFDAYAANNTHTGSNGLSGATTGAGGAGGGTGGSSGGSAGGLSGISGASGKIVIKFN